MTTLTYASLTVYASSLSAANAEAILDDAINKLNMYGLSINNLSGTSGSKTVTVSSGEAGAIISVAMAIYSGFYATSGSQSSSTTLPGFSESVSNSSGQGINAIEETARNAALQLKTKVFTRTR